MKIAAVDHGVDPFATLVTLAGDIVVFGYGLAGAIRNADRQISNLQRRRDKIADNMPGVRAAKIGKAQAGKRVKDATAALKKGELASYKTAQRKYWDARRDALQSDECLVLTKTMEAIRASIKHKTAVAREEAADFMSNFDLLIMPKLDLKVLSLLV
jgi:hypothetical protein